MIEIQKVAIYFNESSENDENIYVRKNIAINIYSRISQLPILSVPLLHNIIGCELIARRNSLSIVNRTRGNGLRNPNVCA